MCEIVIFLSVAERMEKTMRVAIVASSLVLSACTTPAQQASTDLKKSLDAMVGQPVEVAIARLGEPIASVPVGSDSVYGWGYGFTRTEFSNAAPGWIDAASAEGGVFPAPRRAVHDGCVIRMVVGGDGRIQDWNHQGNDRSCRDYADHLVGQAVARAD
jgi:hypothetical protein